MKNPGRAEELPDFDPGRQADSAVKRSWLTEWRESRRSGGSLSASELVNRHPALALRSNSVLMLAYDEYCRRQAVGESVDRSAFCCEFPAHQQSLARLLSVHEYLKDNSRLPTDLVVWETWPEIGETVAGFKLIDGLGLGAFARVFVAAEPAVAHRRVAVKVSVEGASEAEILGKLSHPNIVQILSVQPDEQLRWTLICMPYLGQATLDDVICQLFSCPGGRPRQAHRLLQTIELLNLVGEAVEPLPPDPKLAGQSYVEGVVHLMAQLADALAHAHAKGICHRDLKPSNVLLTPGGKPMLLDFNLAQDEQVDGRRLGGTLPYMAPEQLYATVLEPQSGGAKVDPRSDLFSLGVIAYELLSGSWPYGPILSGLAHDEFATELWERQRSGPTPLAECSTDVDPKVSSLIQRCLAFDPADRLQTAVELAAALRQCLSPAQRLRRLARAHRRWVAAATAAAVLLALSFAYLIATRPPYAERELLQANAAIASHDRDSAIWHLEEAIRSGLRTELHGEAAECYYRIGKRAFDERDYGQALEHFAKAAHYGLSSWELWFYRGAANYRTGEYELADSDFAKAQLRPAPAGFIAALPQLMACRGDCAMRRGKASTAQAVYRAVLQQNYESIAVLNNMGWAASSSGAPNLENFKLAENYLNLAIERAIKEFADQRDSRLQPLFYNRAVNGFRLSMMVKEKCDLRTKQDIQIAIACGSDCAWPWQKAAEIQGWMIQEGDLDWPAAIHFMEEAIKRGAPFDEPANHPICGKLQVAVRNLPGFDDLRRSRIREDMAAPPIQLDVLDEMLGD